MKLRTVFVFLPLLAVGLSACGPKQHMAHPAEGVPTARVKVRPIGLQVANDIEEVVGTVRARLRATLEAKISGQIVEMPIVLGQEVEAGALVARLSAPEVEARLDAAKAGLELAEREWNRISTLFRQQAATGAENESAESRLKVAKASLAEAEAMMNYVRIAAPFKGRVTRKAAERGDLAVPGKPLVDLEDATALELEAFLPETLAGYVQAGAEIDLRGEIGERIIRGRVSEMAPAADPASRTLLVKVALLETVGMRPGQFARLLVPTGERQFKSVPIQAVVHRGQLDLVFTVQANRAVLHLVRTGRKTGDQVEVLSGLPESGDVVIRGAEQLVDGQPVVVE